MNAINLSRYHAFHLYKAISLLCFVFHSLILNAQTYVLTKNREPQLHVKNYKQIAIGDIVGPNGIENERSLDLRDALTSKFFNSNIYEVVDRNALSQILSSQKKSDVKIIDEKTISALSKQLKSALLITGRMQSEKVEQKLYTTKNGTCPDNSSNHWLVTGEIAVQLKIIDVNTGKMIFSAPVLVPIKVQSIETCQPKEKFDLKPIVNKAFEALPDEVAKLIIPYAEQINITFEGPAVVLFKNPFKKLNEVVSLFTIGDFDKGITILKNYAEDNSLKNNLKAKAHYNYALGLFCINQYEQAKIELKKAIALDASGITYEAWYAKIDTESVLDKNSAMH